MTNSNSFQQALYNLVNKEPFYGSVLLGLPVEFTTKIPTLGVSLKDKIKLYVNLEFFEQNTLDNRVKFLRHESMHIMFNHFTRSKDKNHKRFNIAADVAINQLIPEFPDELEIEGKGKVKLATINNALKDIPTLDRYRESEYYYDKMVNNQDSDNETMDNHDWETNLTEEEIKEELKDILKRAVEYTKGINREVPTEAHAALEKLSNSKVSWKKLLQNFVQNSSDTVKEDTRKRRNRRYGLVHPGSKNAEVLHLGIAVDTSASVSDEELNEFFTEISKIHSLGIDITVIECDEVIRKVSKFDPKKNTTFSGRGGTAYQPALDKAKELKVDALLVLGDGDCADELTKPGYPVLWCLVRNGTNPSSFGKTIHL